MSANNTFSLLNETEGSDTSYRNVHISYRLHYTPGMAWSETLKEDFGYEPDTVSEPVVEEPKHVEVVEEKVPAKKSKKAKKAAPKKAQEEDLDSILMEMGIELNENVDIKSGNDLKKEEPEKKKMGKRNNSKAASIIANETAQRRNMKKKGKK